MQVFVPWADFDKSVKSLDNKRLNKQALEATQILDAILGLPTLSGKPRTGWLRHPAVIAFRDTPGALVAYLEANVRELKSRGYKPQYAQDKLKQYEEMNLPFELPIWWGDEIVHRSHRYRLLQKPFEEYIKRGDWSKTTRGWYENLGWDEMSHDNLFYEEYQWPIIHENSYTLENRATKVALDSKIEIRRRWPRGYAS